jgi:MoxR-like ATPase
MEKISSDQVSPKQLREILILAIKNRLPILIKGRPGVGKTDIVKQAAEACNARLIISHPVVSDPTDYKGLPFADPDGKTARFLPFGDLAELRTAQEETVFFLDDLGQAPAAVQAACMQLILARRINGHQISDHVTFLAATNRREDKAGVMGILEPVKSRFSAIVELVPDALEWSEWALKENLPF